MPSVTIYILLIVLPTAFSHYSDLSTDQNNKRIIVNISDKIGQFNLHSFKLKKKKKVPTLNTKLKSTGHFALCYIAVN